MRTLLKKFLQQIMFTRPNNDLDYHILETKHNTLNGKFTDFDLSLKILLDATAGENMKSIP